MGEQEEEQYLLAWNDHHNAIITAMADLASGDVLTDVSVWAGQSLYSAHRLVLALSSHYFRLVVTGLAGEGRHPVIFLKDISSRDFERLLQYMYRGEVSVPQTELLSLITAARSLGIRGLAEGILPDEGRESANHASAHGSTAPAHVDRKSVHKRSAASASGADSQLLSLLKKPRTELTNDLLPSPPLLPPSTGKEDSAGNERADLLTNTVDSVSPKRRSSSEDEDQGSRNQEDEHQRRRFLLRSPVDGGESGSADQTSGNQDEAERGNAENDKNRRNKNVPSFLEVNVKQEKEDDVHEKHAYKDERDHDRGLPPAVRLVRRPLLFSGGPPGLLPGHLVPHHPGLSSPLALGPPMKCPPLQPSPSPTASAIQRNTGTCHFCGRSFMKNKQLMNHVCPMRPPAKN